MKTTLEKKQTEDKVAAATLLGEEVGKILNKSLNKCNKLLNKYGYGVSLTLNFHELENKETTNL